MYLRFLYQSFFRDREKNKYAADCEEIRGGSWSNMIARLLNRGRVEGDTVAGKFFEISVGLMLFEREMRTGQPGTCKLY